jgi:hypothetical protein
MAALNERIIHNGLRDLTVAERPVGAKHWPAGSALLSCCCSSAVDTRAQPYFMGFVPPAFAVTTHM